MFSYGGTGDGEDKRGRTKASCSDEHANRRRRELKGDAGEHDDSPNEECWSPAQIVRRERRERKALWNRRDRVNAGYADIR